MPLCLSWIAFRQEGNSFLLRMKANGRWSRRSLMMRLQHLTGPKRAGNSNVLQHFRPVGQHSPTV